MIRVVAASSSVISSQVKDPGPPFTRFSSAKRVTCMSFMIESSNSFSASSSSSGAPTALRARAIMSAAVNFFLGASPAEEDMLRTILPNLP